MSADHTPAPLRGGGRAGALGARTVALLALGVLGVSMSGPLLAATAAPALALGFWRNAVGAAVTAPVAVARRSGRPVVRAGLPPAVLAGGLLALHFALWIPSLRLTSVAASTALVTTTPVWTVLADRLLGRRVPRPVAVGVGVATLGVLTVTGGDAATSARAALGDALALVGGMAAAGYMVAGERARQDLSTPVYTTLAYGVCALLLLPVCLVAQVALVGYPTLVWGQIAVLVLTAQLFGHTALNQAIRRAGATTVALVVLLETPGAALIAWGWLGQRPPWTVLPGAVLVLLGLVLVVRGRVVPPPAPQAAPAGTP